MDRHILNRGARPIEPTIASYVTELTAHLKRDVPEADAKAIVAETEAHLADRVDDIVNGGLSRPMAERSAIAEFCDPRIYARRLTYGFFASKSAILASRAGRTLLSSTFLLMLTVTVLGRPFVNAVFNIPGLGESIVLSTVFLVPLLTVVFAFQARRPQTKLVIVYGLMVTLVELISTGYFTTRLPNRQIADRRGAKRLAADRREELAEFRKEINLLDIGSREYSAASAGAIIDPELRSGDRYVVPATLDGNALQMIQMHENPLPPAFIERWVSQSGSAAWGPSVVRSRSEAERRWRSLARVWREAKVQEIADTSIEVGYYEAAAREPVVFSTQYLNANDLQPALFALILGSLDFAGAWMGRRIFIVRRRRRNRQMTDISFATERRSV